MLENNLISVREANEASTDRNVGKNKANTASSDKGNGSIVESQNDEKNVRYHHGLYVIVILLICIVYTATQTLIPYHDVFEFPSFWWETLIQHGIFYIALRNVLTTV